MSYRHRIGIALIDWLLASDRAVNVLAGGRVGETISYRAAKARQKGSFGACVLCRILDIFQRDHCTKTVKADDRDKQIAPILSRLRTHLLRREADACKIWKDHTHEKADADEKL